MIRNIFQYIQEYMHPIYAVGGCLRQKYLGLFIDDYDLIVSHGAIELSKEIAQKFHLNWIVLDHERDIARIFCDGVTVDIAAFGTDLNKDLIQRDITINAIACLADERLLEPGFVWCQKDLIDPCGGFQDLQNKVIRGISWKNFESDPLRVLRVFRFSAALGFLIEKNTLLWAKSLVHLLDKIASERILNEVFKLFIVDDTVSTLQKMSETKILAQIFAYSSHLDTDGLLFQEMQIAEELFLSIQSAHTTSYLQDYAADKRPYQFLLKIALLFWQGIDQQHISIDKLTQKIAMSRHEESALSLWFREAPVLQELIKKPEDARLWFYFFRRCGKHLVGLCVLGMIWLKSGRWTGNINILETMIGYWFDKSNGIAHPVELVNGKDVLQHTKIKPGPRIGEILLTIQEAQACGDILTREHALERLKAFSPE